MSRTTPSTPAFEWPSSRLCRPNSPKYIRTNSNPTAMPYAATTKARTNRPLRRPSGKARKTCKNSTGGTRSMAWPIVCGTSFVDHTSVEAKLTKPAAIINGPKRLVGRRRQAKSPQSMYESVRRAVSTAITRGSPDSIPTPPPATVSANEKAAAAHPTAAIAHETEALSSAGAAPRSKPAAIAEAAMVSLLPCPRPGRNLSGAAAIDSRGGRKEASTGEHTPASHQRPLAEPSSAAAELKAHLLPRTWQRGAGFAVPARSLAHRLAHEHEKPCKSVRLWKSRKPFRALGSDEGSNPSPSVQPSGAPG